MNGFNFFMKNPSWKRIYDNAPTNLLKEYFRLKFDTDIDYYINNDYNEKLNTLRGKFTNIEWQYLIDTTENITAKVYYKSMLK